MRRIRVALLAIGLSGALILGHATNTTAMVQLANTVIGVGGQGDAASARVPDKLNHTVIPTGYDYFPVQYPATVQLATSRDVAVPIVHHYLVDTGAAEQHLIVAGYSLGTMVGEQERRNLQQLKPIDAPSTDQLSFVMIASPFAGDGGIFGRFPGIGIPFITDAMGAAQPSRYDTTYSARMYDTYADFPAYFNPIALLNSALSIRYGHPDAYYDPIDPATTPKYVTEKDNSAGGHDTYVLYYAQHLPLLAPLRELAALTGTSALAEPLISAVEPLLRVLVDMSYTNRVNANPATPTPFSFITPLGKFIEALGAIPGALAQGAANLVTGGHAPVTLPDPIGNLEQPSVTAIAAPQVHQSPARLALAPSAPKKTLDDDPVKPLDLATSSVPTTSSMSVSSVATSTAAAADLHPRVTSDGNKFTPGTVSDTPDSGGTDTPTTPTPATDPTTTTTTTTATSTTTTTTGGAPTGAAAEGGTDAAAA